MRSISSNTLIIFTVYHRGGDLADLRAGAVCAEQLFQAGLHFDVCEIGQRPGFSVSAPVSNGTAAHAATIENIRSICTDHGVRTYLDVAPEGTAREVDVASGNPGRWLGESRVSNRQPEPGAEYVRFPGGQFVTFPRAETGAA